MKSHPIQQVVLHIVFALMSVACLFPFILLLSASISDEKSIIKNGYSLLPTEFSMAAYTYLWKQGDTIFHAYGITVIITVIGTLLGLFISSMIAYTLSRRDVPLRGILTFLVFFTMLFNGGLVPTYLVFTEVFHLKNTLMALIIPGLLTNGFFILLIRTFFSSSIPIPILESAWLDGAGEFKIFTRIVLPLSLPILATIGLMLMIGYWNDWFNGMIYVTDSKLFSIQNLLNRMLSDMQFMQSTNIGSNQSQATSSAPLSTVRMAMAVIGVIPIICAYPFFQKYFVKGLTIGAVKG